MPRRAHLWLLVFALLGVGASSTSAWVHYRLLSDPGYTSFCDVNSTVNCTEAYLSAYGSLLGTPVAVFGVLWFVGILGLLAGGRPGGGRLAESVAGYVFALSTVGLAVILYLAYGAFFVLRAVCLLCVLTYVAVIGLFVVSGAQTRFPMSSLPRRVLHDLRAATTSPVALAALVVFFAGAASAIAFFPKEPAPVAAAAQDAATPAVSSDQRTEVERWFDSQPRTIVPIGDPGGAAVVIVEFNDYQCPSCRMIHDTYKPILAKYRAQAPGKVLFLTKDYPLDSECNVNVARVVHPLACEAAVGVRLARTEEKAEALKDWLFANQPTLTAEALKQAVREVGGVNDFDAKYAQAVDLIKTDVAMGKLLGVEATPTFFINGVKVSGGLQPQFFDAVIAYELRKAAK